MLKHTKIIAVLCFIFLSSTADCRELYLRRNFPVNYAKGTYIKAESGLVLYKKLKKNSSHTPSIYKNKKGKKNVLVGLSLGYDFNKHVGTEILGRFSKFKYDNLKCETSASQEMDSYSLFWNFYLKHVISKRIEAYVGGGPGIAFNRSKSFVEKQSLGNYALDNITNPGKNKNSFVWNIGAGAGYYVTKKLMLNIGYRYLTMGEIGVNQKHFSDSESRKIRSHDITLGLKYKF